MFEVKAEGVDPLVAKFDKLAAQVEALHHQMPEELTAWQVEDMRRKFPNIAVTQANNMTSAETDIWPRSRLQLNRKSRRAAFKQPKRFRLKGARFVRSLHKPILRPELFDKLRVRMGALIKKAMAWP